MEIPIIYLRKCQCGSSFCDYHGFTFGTFHQGTGWGKPVAEELAHRINIYPTLKETLQWIRDYAVGCGDGTLIAKIDGVLKDA